MRSPLKKETTKRTPSWLMLAPYRCLPLGAGSVRFHDHRCKDLQFRSTNRLNKKLCSLARGRDDKSGLQFVPAHISSSEYRWIGPKRFSICTDLLSGAHPSRDSCTFSRARRGATQCPHCLFTLQCRRLDRVELVDTLHNI